MDKAKLHNFTVWFNNSEEYHHLKGEIFTQNTYYFETENPTPVIIDAGAHIGLSTLYFKKLFPAAQITAIEPHPESYKLLEKNVFENMLDDVTTHNVALAAESGPHTFFIDSTSVNWQSTAGFNQGAWNNTQNTEAASVTAKKLTDFITGPVDFLKMDIEGAEQEVLRSARFQLHLVKHMMIEFHPTPDQSLVKLCELLEQLRFTLTFWKGDKEIKMKQARGLILIEAVQKS